MSEQIEESLRRLRQTLHQSPELAGNEVATGQIMATFLQASMPTRTLEGLGGNGLAVCFDSGRQGPSVMARAELDALPIAEAGRLPYRSQTPGIAHLCGHDGHMAMLAGLAARLSAGPPSCGRVWLLLQPAEETGEGARHVAADPAFREIDPDWVVALHNLPGTPLGTVAIRRGTFACGSIGLIVRLTGRSSHAGYPEQGLSPAAAVARLIDAFHGLSELVAAEHGTEGIALATVIHARLGEVAFGTSPGEAVVMVTLRADDHGTMRHLRASAERLATGIASSQGLEHQLEWTEELPITINHDGVVDLVCQAARAEQLEAIELPEPLRWSEDFGHFTAQAAGALIGIGSGVEQPPLHSPHYDFPDGLIPIGVRLLAAVVERFLRAGTP